MNKIWHLAVDICLKGFSIQWQEGRIAYWSKSKLFRRDGGKFFLAHSLRVMYNISFLCTDIFEVFTFITNFHLKYINTPMDPNVDLSWNTLSYS